MSAEAETRPIRSTPSVRLDEFIAIKHKLRSEVPLWVMGSVFAVVALVAFAGLRAQLHRQTENDLSHYIDVVKLAPQPAYVTITLP